MLWTLFGVGAASMGGSFLLVMKGEIGGPSAFFAVAGVMMMVLAAVFTVATQ